MIQDKGIRSARLSTVFLAALSLSIGWGIRGNFGHEYGAMIPGALTAIAVCLLSGRDDWRARVPYFAFFGAIGWAFGGSISYMQVIAYSHSGDEPTQYYGFFGLFLIGFLWAGMGGAGTALPAVIDRDRLTALFRPICWVLAVFLMLYLLYERVVERWEHAFNGTEFRHMNPLYWFDADWIPASAALIAMFAFDLWDRRFAKAPWLPVFAAVGALSGFLAQQLINLLGLTGPLASFLVQRQGDAASIAQKEGISLEQAAESLVINWPQIFLHIPQHIGWIFGLILGVSLYFCRFGKFRSGASLFVYMGGGWLAGLILLPTLLGFGGAGLRLTPPRSDDWAGILGVYIGTLIWLRRNKLIPVLYASLVSAAIGGFGFAGAAWLKIMMMAPGNPARTSDPAVIEHWAHWQGANWHSFLEQSYGFINGIAIAVALALIARRVGRTQGDPMQQRWTEVFAAGFVLFIVTFINIYKNVPVWLEAKIVPETMKAPLFPSIELPANIWFVIVYALMTLAGFYLLARHLRRPLPTVPLTWLGKGQMLYLVFLWATVVANFERALPGFSEGRLITEWVIFLNAILATVLILTLPREDVPVPDLEQPKLGHWRLKTAAILIALFAITLGAMTPTVRALYGNNPVGHAGLLKRFGPDAAWITEPLRRGQEHK